LFHHLLPCRDCNEAARGRVALNDGVTILVVEDDQLIQAMVEEALSDGGFASALTASGEEAITLLQDDKSEYQAVVTDINLLGKLDGWEVGRSAREIDPTMPIIYMTGIHGEEWASKGVPNSLLLVKPFAPAQIVTAISQLLNAAPPVPPTT
jgi:DNA-binding response OmpR family regulator